MGVSRKNYLFERMQELSNGARELKPCSLTGAPLDLLLLQWGFIRMVHSTNTVELTSEGRVLLEAYLRATKNKQ